MRRVLIVLFVLLLVSGSAGGRTEFLRIGTWNLHNYLIQNRWVDGKFTFSYPKPEAEKATQRRLLLQLRPDILLLQEIGSEEDLGELRIDLAASGLTYPYWHFAVLPGARSGLALLSRLPPAEVIFLHAPMVGPDADPEILRGVQEILLTFHGRRIRIFHVHLKSRYTSDKADPDSVQLRTGELYSLVRLLQSRLAVYPAGEWRLLAGDLNTPWDDALLADLKAGWRPLRAVDAYGEDWTFVFLKTGKQELIDGFWEPLPQQSRFSGTLFPLTAERPIGSDHRLVILDWIPRDATPTDQRCSTNSVAEGVGARHWVPTHN